MMMATVSLTEQDLLNIKLTVLTLERQEIARNIDPRRFFGHLRSKYVFDEQDCDEIRSVKSRIESAEAFVDILKRKGSQGYDEFCNALMKDQTQLFLLQKMNKTLEQLRAKVIQRKTEKNAMKPIIYHPHMHPFPHTMNHDASHPMYPPHPRHVAPPPGPPFNHIPTSFPPQFPATSSSYHHQNQHHHPPPPSSHRVLRKVNSRNSEGSMEGNTMTPDIPGQYFPYPLPVQFPEENFPLNILTDEHWRFIPGGPEEPCGQYTFLSRGGDDDVINETS